jgi:cytoskeletal protein CcmA (bactofilin family)
VTRPLAVLGEGGTYRGDVEFEGRARIDGLLLGSVAGEDLVEIGPSGRVDGEVRAPQVLVAGGVDGAIIATERCTLLDTAVVRGRVVTPWLDVRLGARIEAQVAVERPAVQEQVPLDIGGSR